MIFVEPGCLCAAASRRAAPPTAKSSFTGPPQDRSRYFRVQVKGPLACKDFTNLTWGIQSRLAFVINPQSVHLFDQFVPDVALQ